MKNLVATLLFGMGFFYAFGVLGKDVEIPKPLAGGGFYQFQKIKKKGASLTAILQPVDFFKDKWIKGVAQSCQASKTAFQDGRTSQGDLKELGSCQGYPALPDGYYVRSQKKPAIKARVDQTSELNLYQTGAHNDYVLHKTSLTDLEMKHRVNPHLICSLILSEGHVVRLQEQYLP